MSVARNTADTAIESPFALPPLERVRQLEGVIRAGGDNAQQLRRLDPETAEALIEAGLFRFTLPRALGGEDASIRETIAVLEAISAIDGSVGWNVMIGSEINAMAAGGMPLDLAKRVYLDNPRVIMCGGGGPGTIPGRAVSQPDGGYRVWGRTSFISGCHNAEWCFMAAPIFDGETPRMGPGGQPIVRTWFLHRDEYQILDTWDVAGLRGSGSHDVLAEGAHVPAEWARVELMVLPAQHENPVFRVPVLLRLAYNKAAVALGVARGALDALATLARDKTPMLSASKLMDRPIAQYRIGQAEGELRAARAFLFEAMAELEEELGAGADAPSARTTQAGRLACVHAANAAMRVVDEAHNTAGTSAARMDNPLERKLRDAHGVASHRWVAHPLYQDLGSIFLGHPPSPEFAGAGGAGLSSASATIGG